jgi:hypothetical protein
MSIVSWEPEHRNEVVQRFAEKGSMAIPGRKVIGTWNAIGQNLVFRLVDIENPKALAVADVAWSDLVKIEEIPVMETGELIKIISDT